MQFNKDVMEGKYTLSARCIYILHGLLLTFALEKSGFAVFHFAAGLACRCQGKQETEIILLFILC